MYGQIRRRKLTTEQEKERREKRAKERELYAKQLDAQKLASLQSKLSMLKAHMEVVEENEVSSRASMTKWVGSRTLSAKSAFLV